MQGITNRSKGSTLTGHDFFVLFWKQCFNDCKIHFDKAEVANETSNVLKAAQADISVDYPTLIGRT